MWPRQRSIRLQRALATSDGVPEASRCGLAGSPKRPQIGFELAAIIWWMPDEEEMMAVFSDPYNALSNFQQALDAFRASSWLDAGPSGGGAYPPLDVFRKGDDFIIITELPGVKKSDLEVQVKGGRCAFRGPRPSPFRRKRRCIGASGSRAASTGR